MSTARYEHYKESGVAWLGKVPEHWNTLPLLAVGRERDEKNTGMAESNLLSLSYGRIIRKDIETNEGLLPESFETYQIVYPGDIIFRLTDLQNDKRSLRTAIVEERGIITSAYLALEPLNVNPQFLNYLFRAYDLRKVFYAMGGGVRQSMNYQDVKRMNILLPPREEQAAITTFLDRETAKIVALVQEQQRLIALLKQKRQAVISHAVTKGLNPAAAMKDSGLEWLGEIPEGWRLLPVKKLARSEWRSFVDGDWVELPFITEDGVRLLQTGNVGIGFFKEQGFRYIAESSFSELGCTEVLPGDVLICRLDGPVGRACLAPTLGVRMITSVDNTILKVSNEIDSRYVVCLMSSGPWLAWLDALCRVGGGHRVRISRIMLGDLRIPCPSFEEQRKIADTLEERTREIDALSNEAEDAIELLQERRSVLISAAVTGRIDVRGLSANTSEVTEAAYEPA